MGSIIKRGEAWRAQVRKKGHSITRTFDRKGDAIEWVSTIEAQIRQQAIDNAGLEGSANDISNRRFVDLLHRYIADVSPTMRGHRWNMVRISTLIRVSPDMVAMKATDVTSEVIGRWRNAELQRVSAASVNRTLNLLSAVCTIAVKEWKWLKVNPCQGVVRPPPTPPRERRVSDWEVDAMLAVLGYKQGVPPVTAAQNIAYAMLLALETGMRKGELLALTADDLNFPKRHLVVQMSKNGSRRFVPLSLRAIELFDLMLKGPEGSGPKDDPITKAATRRAARFPAKALFKVSSEVMDVLWRRARRKAAETNPEIATLHFHDLRHEAVSRLARKIDVLDLARMIGHKDLKSLMIYYNATPEEIASRLG